MSAAIYYIQRAQSVRRAEVAQSIDIEEAWALAEEEDKAPPEIGSALELRNGRILSHFSTGFYLSPIPSR